jgi:hypothetical protein
VLVKFAMTVTTIILVLGATHAAKVMVEETLVLVAGVAMVMEVLVYPAEVVGRIEL